jgi:hypothetical protein
MPWTPSLRRTVARTDLLLAANGESASVLRRAGAGHVKLLPDMPHRPGLDGILASWGNTVLEPLDTENRKAFAEGRRLGKGYYAGF